MPTVAEAKRRRVRITIAQVGNNWTLLVFHALASGPLRFMELKRAIGSISQRSLTQALRDLERDGYLARKVYPTSPPKVEYRLTSLGQSLLKPIRSLMDWSEVHLAEVMESRRTYDALRQRAAVQSEAASQTVPSAARDG